MACSLILFDDIDILLLGRCFLTIVRNAGIHLLRATQTVGTNAGFIPAAVVREWVTSWR
ncbi:MAG: hypothetical protein PVS2B2_17080 [Candidatus Acidiferrum sp.]